MHNHKDETRLDDSAGPHPARDKETLVGIDDIGLPSGIQPPETGTPEQIKPDPEQTRKQS